MSAPFLPLLPCTGPISHQADDSRFAQIFVELVEIPVFRRSAVREDVVILWGRAESPTVPAPSQALTRCMFFEKNPTSWGKKD